MKVCAGDSDSASRAGRCHTAPCPCTAPKLLCRLCPQEAVTPCTIPCTQIPSPAPGRADRNESSSGSSSFLLVPFPGCTYVIQAQHICADRKLLWCLCERTVTYSGCNELSWGAAKSLQAVAALHKCKMQTEAAGTAFIQPLALPSYPSSNSY